MVSRRDVIMKNNYLLENTNRQFLNNKEVCNRSSCAVVTVKHEEEMYGFFLLFFR